MVSEGRCTVTFTQTPSVDYLSTFARNTFFPLGPFNREEKLLTPVFLILPL